MQNTKSFEPHVLLVNLKKAARDLRYRWEYGLRQSISDAPILFTPENIQYICNRPPERAFSTRDSGYVFHGDWDLSRRDVTSLDKYQSCKMRFIDGADWEETPAFQRLARNIEKGKKPDGCDSYEALKARYAALDEVFAQTKAHGRLLARSELPKTSRSRRENGAILIHLDRNGTFMRGGDGAHRYAIARLLKLQNVRGQLGWVHPGAIRGGHLQCALAETQEFLSKTNP